MGGISVMFLLGMLSFLFFVFIAVLVLAVIFTVVRYILDGISVMRMAENLKFRHSGTVWIPFYNSFMIGKIAGNRALGAVSGAFLFVSAGLSIYFYVVGESNDALFAVLLVCLLVAFITDTVLSHRIYRNALGVYGDILTVLTVISLGILRPILLFIIRNRVHEKATENDAER